MLFVDLSFNKMGGRSNKEVGLKLGEACNNGRLRHFDLSYNGLDLVECEELGKTIY